MTRFREELRLIPPVAWIIGVVGYLSMAIGLQFVILSESASPPYLLRLVLLLAPVPLLLYVLLVGYVHRDAKRRAMRHVLWTWVAALVPNGIGIILYFVMREPIAPSPCPKCGAMTRPGFAFCTQCGTGISPACPGCRRTTQPDWTHCAYCGANLTQTLSESR